MNPSRIDPCRERPQTGVGFDPGLGGGRGKRLLLEAAVLASLTDQAAHGYDLHREIAQLTDGFLLVDRASLYRLLRQLEQEGSVTSTWTEGEFGPQRREYRLTAAGCERLLAWRPHLEARERAFRSVIESIDRATEARSSTPRRSRSRAS